MAGQYTRSMYDRCYEQQNLKQSTDPLSLILDTTKYVNCNNLCQPSGNAALYVDVESGLRGLDKIASKCDSAKLPFCTATGCLGMNDPRIPEHITPYACSWGHAGDRAVVNTNMSMPKGSGITLPPTNPCGRR